MKEHSTGFVRGTAVVGAILAGFVTSAGAKERPAAVADPGCLDALGDRLAVAALPLHVSEPLAGLVGAARSYPEDDRDGQRQALLGTLLAELSALAEDDAYTTAANDLADAVEDCLAAPLALAGPPVNVPCGFNDEIYENQTGQALMVVVTVTDNCLDARDPKQNPTPSTVTSGKRTCKVKDSSSKACHMNVQDGKVITFSCNGAAGNCTWQI